MFNNSLKKEALKIHENSRNRYADSYNTLTKECEKLYDTRKESATLISFIEEVINTIVNTPKSYSTKMGKIHKELDKFKETEEYAKNAYETSLKAGGSLAGGAAVGVGVASIAPKALMGVATTYGVASTGTAISSLSGAAAQKAATAWIGRTIAGFAVKEGAGMAVGQTVLALSGPIGWGISIASTGASLTVLTFKNKKIADEAIEEAKKIEYLREQLDESILKVKYLRKETNQLYKDLSLHKTAILTYANSDFKTLSEEEKDYLAMISNNTYSLSALLNKTIY